MECEPIIVASLIDNVNSCKNVFDIKSSDTITQNTQRRFDGEDPNAKSTCMKESRTSNKKQRQVERFNFTRSASSPVIVVQSPPKHCTPSDEVKESRTENGTGCELELKPRHVSFDECVHVLTKCSVIEMPLKNSTMEDNMSTCGCQYRKGILKHEIGTKMKKVSFERDELLRMAIIDHDLSEFVHVCQQWKANFNTKLSNGLTPLHLVSIEGCFRMVQFILQQGARVDELDEYGWTSLHYSALHGHVPCAMVLLQAGADINARTADQRTVIELAAQDEMLLLLGRVMNGPTIKACLDENKETYV